MNILLMYPWLTLGGAPNDVITIAKGLKDRGHNVCLFTKGGGMYEERLKELEIPYVSAPYSFILPRLYHLNLRALNKLNDTLIRYSIDVVHAFHPYSYILALFAAPLKNIPAIFTATWFVEEWPYPSYPGRIIFVAEEFKDQGGYLFRGYPREMIVLPNRVDLEMFRPGLDYREVADRYSLPDSGWKIAFMSRIDSWKINSLRYAAKAAGVLHSRGRDVTLVIAGDGPLFDELEDFVSRVNESAGKEVVRLLGAIEETPQFLSWADIVLGIGRCAWEGMACGKPTLVVGENGLAGIVEEKNLSELAYYNFAGRNVKEPVSEELLVDAVERIMNDKSYYDKLSKYARECSLKHYDYRAGVEELESIYERSLNDPPLTGWEKVKLLVTNFLFGYLPRAYIALRLFLRVKVGRGRPEDYYER